MANWRYKLEREGKILRELINDAETMGDIVAIYKQLIICLESWKKKLLNIDKEDWEYEIETMIEDLEYACPDFEDSEISYEEASDNLDYHLEDFYNLCDSAGVWIGV